MQNLSGNNYQITGTWREGGAISFTSYYGYAVTKREAKETIDLIAKREDSKHIEKWAIIDRRSGESEEYTPKK